MKGSPDFTPSGPPRRWSGQLSGSRRPCSRLPPARVGRAVAKYTTTLQSLAAVYLHARGRHIGSQLTLGSPKKPAGRPGLDWDAAWEPAEDVREPKVTTNF